MADVDINSPGAFYDDIGKAMTAIMNPPFNVKHYGALGDSTTDDSAAIQAAIDACDANRGGTVLFPQGRYKIVTGLIVTKPGTQLIGEGGRGVSSDLANGSTRIIVGNGIWGVTIGSSSSSIFLGSSIRDLMFCEENAGQALGGVKLLRTSNCYFEGLQVGAFTAGTGFLADGTGDQTQYNTFVDCRFGKCAKGYEQKAANGTVMLSCYFDGSTNGLTPTASTTGCLITSGDTFRAIGTRFQGYDTLLDLSANIGHHVEAARFEVFTTQAVILRGGAGAQGAKITGQADNSLNGSIGTGVVLSSGVIDPDIDLHIVNVATRVTDNGATRPTIRVKNPTQENVQQLIRFNTLGGPYISSGSATPEGNITAPVGSVYMRTGGGASTTFYVKETGSGNTGWIAYGAAGGGGSLTTDENILAADTTMTTAGTFYDGATLTLAAGTWIIQGQIELLGSTTASRTFTIRLWDGSTIYIVANYITFGTAVAPRINMPIHKKLVLASPTTIKLSGSSSINSDIIKGTSGSGATILTAIKTA